MLKHHRIPTPIPRCEVHTTIATAMLDVLRRVHEVRDTGQRHEEAEKEGPQTLEEAHQHSIHQPIPKRKRDKKTH
jgi:hypothetical protein